MKEVCLNVPRDLSAPELMTVAGRRERQIQAVPEAIGSPGVRCAYLMTVREQIRQRTGSLDSKPWGEVKTLPKLQSQDFE